VKHIVVNGAFNPGNSGGPLFQSGDSKVIGVVVAKFHLYPPQVAQTIQMMQAPGGAGVSSFGLTDEHGERYSDAQITGMVLAEFYKATQVMIGEAISVSELRAFLNKKRAEVQ